MVFVLSFNNLAVYPVQGSIDSSSILNEIRNVIREFINEPKDEMNPGSDTNISRLDQINTTQLADLNNIKRTLDQNLTNNTQDIDEVGKFDIMNSGTSNESANNTTNTQLSSFDTQISDSQGNISSSTFNSSETSDYLTRLLQDPTYRKDMIISDFGFSTSPEFSSNNQETSDFGFSTSPEFSSNNQAATNSLTEENTILDAREKKVNIIPHDDTDGFKANGLIDSVILTANSNWDATGDWSLIVEDGEVSNFTTTMAWYNGTSSHTHEFLNFVSDDEITLPTDNLVTIDGQMDIGSNGEITWEEVESTITIGGGGKTITISLDHDATDHHFAGQTIRGTTTYLAACSDEPGPNMELQPSCS